MTRCTRCTRPIESPEETAGLCPVCFFIEIADDAIAATKDEAIRELFRETKAVLVENEALALLTDGRMLRLPESSIAPEGMGP